MWALRVMWVISVADKKNRHRGRFFEEFGFCCCVNLPLLHRLGAGIAKVKRAAKKQGAVHGRIRNRLNDYSNKWRRLARAAWPPPWVLLCSATGCGNPTFVDSTVRRLILLSRIGVADARL
jgi:hypothetical protein